MFTVAATGHRPDKLGGYQYSFELLVKIARQNLERLKPTQVITGMALGWDTAVAQACAELGIPFIAAIPFKGQEQKWPKASRDNYHRLLGLASKVIIVSAGNYNVCKMHIRNKWMVDHCSLVLALYDGSSGGTDHCVRYARSKKRPILNVYNEWRINC